MPGDTVVDLISLLLITAGFLLLLLGCAILALNQTKHWRAVAKTAKKRNHLNFRAYMLFLIACWCCVAGVGASFAVLLLPLLFGVASLWVAMLLTYHTKSLVWLASLLRKPAELSR